MEVRDDDSRKPVVPGANHPSFFQAALFWFRLGWISFGGPAGQIAIMHSELVDRRKWIGEARFLHALNYCMLLPGPEAQQLATYSGWLLHGIRGGLVAGILFVLPAVLILWLLSVAYVLWGDVPVVEAIFYGLKSAVMAIVAAAALRIGGKAIGNGTMAAIAVAAFVAIFFGNVPFPMIILGAAVVGLVGERIRPQWFVREVAPGGDGLGTRTTSRPWLRSVLILLVGGILWWAPVVAAGTLLGWDSTIARQGTFFSQAAVVTFGGAYAVLPYVSQQVVDTYGWLTAKEMLDGLGLAETTPGPLIMVLQFVGFVAAWQHPDGLPPMMAATIGAAMTTWVTFVPCFIWIFLGAPFIERLQGNRRLAAALGAVTAAVVGVIVNLALWFGIHVVFPEAGMVDWFALGVAVVAFALLVRWKWDVTWVLGASALVGILARALSGPLF